MKFALLATCSLSLFLSLPAMASGLDTARMALDYANRGDVDRALALFDVALKSTDMDAAARLKTHYNKGTLLLHSSRPDLAIKSFDTVLKEDPRHVDALINQSQAYSLMSKPNDALAAAQKAIEINPHHPEAHYVRGLSLLSLKKEVQAEGSFKQAIEDGGRPDYNVGLARALMAQKKFNEAKTVLDDVIDDYPTHARAYLYRSSLFKGLGDREASDKDIVAAARYGYDDPVIRSFYLKRRFGAKSVFYTVTKKADLLSAPQPKAPVFSTLPKDTFVEATGCDNKGWCRAMFGRSFAGYIRKDALKEVSFKP